MKNWKNRIDFNQQFKYAFYLFQLMSALSSQLHLHTFFTGKTLPPTPTIKTTVLVRENSTPRSERYHDFATGALQSISPTYTQILAHYKMKTALGGREQEYVRSCMMVPKCNKTYNHHQNPDQVFIPHMDIGLFCPCTIS